MDDELDHPARPLVAVAERLEVEVAGQIDGGEEQEEASHDQGGARPGSVATDDPRREKHDDEDAGEDVGEVYVGCSQRPADVGERDREDRGQQQEVGRDRRVERPCARGSLHGCANHAHGATISSTSRNSVARVRRARLVRSSLESSVAFVPSVA